LTRASMLNGGDRNIRGSPLDRMDCRVKPGNDDEASCKSGVTPRSSA
jgi:hypothetical protein